MRAGEASRIAIEAVRANRLRSLLTMLGVIIGVAAVVVLVAIGEGARVQVTAQVQGLGSNIILVIPGKSQSITAPVPSISQLKLADKNELVRVVGDRKGVSATLTSSQTARVGTKEMQVTIQGVDENFPTVFDRPIERGQYLSDTDVSTRRRVAVLGSGVAQQLFAGVDPIGRQLSLAGGRFRVVGVYKELGSAFGVSRDNEVHIPITAAQRMFGVERIDLLAVKAPSAAEVETLQPELVKALKDKHRDYDFTAITQSQILGVIGQILGILTFVLAAIAGISLLVGGVGVSNIMLVSVRERTQEIGLRKALGARQRDILLQFLIEAVMLTSLGGILGILLGIGSALLVGALSPVSAVISWWSPVLAFAVSVSVGIFFGVVPARRAGRLDPVEALRSE